MGTATVNKVDRDSIERERDALLLSVGMSEEELRDRADNYLLTEREVRVWRRIEALSWLADD